MGCSTCKGKSKEEDMLNVFKLDSDDRKVEPKVTDLGFRIFSLAVRFVLFLIGSLLSPLILLFVIYMLFKTIVLNKGTIDLMPSLLSMAKTFGIGKKTIVEESPEDYEDLDSSNPDGYELSERVDKII